MKSLIAPISSLLGGVALLLLGHGLLNTLLTLRGVAEGYSTGMVGLLMSGYFAGFLIGTWLAPSLIRRIGISAPSPSTPRSPRPPYCCT